MNKKITLLITCTLFYLTLFCSCKAESKIKHVVIIGFDGWGAYSLAQADMPTAKEMMQGGAYTLHARSVLPSSSAVNWASMMMGAGPELHGFTDWGSRKPDLPSRVVTKKYGLFPSIFSLLRDQRPEAEIGFFYEWEGMSYLMEQQAASVVQQIKSDTLEPYRCTEEIAEYIRSKKPTFTMVVFDQPDGIGHKYGHGSPEYYVELTKLDGHIARLRQAVKDAGMEDSTLFLLVADHGGINKGHGGKTMDEMEIPLIMFGPEVKKGYEVTESVMIYDIAATVADIFKLSVPQVWIGRPVKSAFEK